MPLPAAQSIFLWENESWDFANSPKSDDEKKKSAVATNSNCSTPKPTAEPPTATTTTITGKKRSKNSIGDEKAGKKVFTESDHEMHIWTERERRKRMRSMFANLHAMLPHLPPKADKSTIVDEAVSYIKTLQENLHKLQKKKEDRLNGIIGSSSLTRSRGDNSSREAFLADHYHQGSASATHSSIIPSLSYLPSPSTSSFPRFPATFRTWVSPNVILSISGDNAHINVCCLKRLGLFTAICYFLEKHDLEVVSFQASSDNYRSMYMIHAKPSGVLHEICLFEEKFQQAAAEIMTYITSLQ